MAKNRSQGVRCTNCGCFLDRNERCDCEQLEAERRAERKRAETRRIVEHNLRIMEQAEKEWEYA